MSDDDEVEKQGRKALDDYVRAVSYPIIWTDDRRLVTLGSAVLFKYRKRHFFLTARHTFDGYDKEALIEFPYEGLIGPTAIDLKRASPIMKVGKKKVHATSGNKAISGDVIAIELLDEDFIKAISHDWQFIGVDNFASPDRNSLTSSEGFPRKKKSKLANKSAHHS